MMKVADIVFPEFSGIQCLMMPYIQGDANSVPEEYRNGYEDILNNVFVKNGDIGYLTIDESHVESGKAQRAYRSKHGRALHTEVGKHPDNMCAWGSWGGRYRVTVDPSVEVLLASNLSNTCAVWDAIHENTSIDGDIGDFADMYPYSDAIMLQSGEVHKIGVLTPHESLPVSNDVDRQFIRIVSSGLHGVEEYFTKNRLM